jgi:hypothetical protein
MFPVRYDLNVYTLFGRNSVFKCSGHSNTHNSQISQTDIEKSMPKGKRRKSIMTGVAGSATR